MIDRLQSIFSSRHLDGIILSKKSTLSYFSTLLPLHPTEREAYLFSTPNTNLLYHGYFITPPKVDNIDTQPMDSQHNLKSTLTTFFSKPERLGIESTDLTHAESQKLLEYFGSVTLVPIDEDISKLKLIKTEVGIKNISTACQITSQVLNQLITEIKAGQHVQVTEQNLAALIDFRLIQSGATGLAFPTIVAFDANSASPHHVVGNSQLTPHSIILIDMGCHYQGYCSDMTRTFKLGDFNEKFAQIETVVKSAHQSALNTVANFKNLTDSQPITTSSAQLKSLQAKDIDAAARTTISTAGFGSNFTHTTGHGLGYDIHESPSINSRNDQLIEPGMTITIEPGIYLPNEFGYRHEDTILVT